MLVSYLTSVKIVSFPKLNEKETVLLERASVKFSYFQVNKI